MGPTIYIYQDCMVKTSIVALWTTLKHSYLELLKYIYSLNPFVIPTGRFLGTSIQKELISQTDYYLVTFSSKTYVFKSSKTYVFKDKLTKY